MKRDLDSAKSIREKAILAFIGLCVGVFFTTSLQAFNLSVAGSDGGNVGSYRWLLEEDVTFHINPQAQNPGQQTLEFHKSYMPVVANGTSADIARLNDPAVVDPAKYYYISVLPDNAGTDAGYTIGGAPVKPNQGAVTVTVNKLPLPTAQVTVFAFEDNFPINNSPNLPQEKGLAGFKVILKDAGGRYGISGGQQMLDVFGNPVGTVGTATTDADGYATFKNLAPGKYAVEVIPPAGQGWLQTTTIEGTKGIDAWVKANEPPLLVEFGVPTTHIFVGFVKRFTDPAAFTGSFSISGQVVNFHMARPPDIAGTAPANTFKNVFIGLNDPAGKGIYAQPADPNTGEFTISNVPPGSYLVTVWDKYLDLIISFQIVNVSNENVDLGQLAVPGWFGRLDSVVFYDANGNGIRDPGEMGMPEQAVNLRFRDGSMYQSFPTDLEGYVPFDEVFPFFNWLIAEVDFARFKATGATIVVDAGGATDPAIYDGLLNPQPQPENGGQGWRAETGEVLLQGIQTFQGQTNRIEWGKRNYGLNESGGITGIVFYAITRAENDPRFGTGDPWEPGVPRVQVSLYADGDVDRAPQGNFPGPEDSDWNGNGILDASNGLIDDVNGDGAITLADVDNYPFGWRDGGTKGPEDVDHNGNGIFDLGDAIAVATTDSWDDNLPTGCPGNTADPALADKCYDGLRNWNQVRPAVFDGGYAFPGYTAEKGEGILPGTYIVQAVPPPGYEIVKEEDKNVDFGDTYTPSPLLLPPVCVGDAHEVPQFLNLFPGQQIQVAGWTPGMTQPLCDRKQVILSQGQNAAADFHLFTEVPIAAHFTGLINNDLGNEFNPNNPTFAEKASASWIPVALRDYLGREITRVYGDQYGTYNGIIHSTYSTNIPNPSGVSPAMYSVCINDPGLFAPDPVTGQLVPQDPFYRREFTTSCYTLMFMPGTTTYLDTPLLPLTAFAGQQAFPLDANFPSGTPVIAAVNGTQAGPYVSGAGGGEQVTITSLGPTSVPNPDYNPNQVGSQPNVTRDYGFGAAQGNGSVTVNGTPLTIDSWGNATIVATVPAGVATGQLMVTRDGGQSTIVGITLTVGGAATTVGAGGIQAAIDAAAPGDLILVPTGAYNELVILYKNVRLQGSGANTIINAVKSPPEKITNWRAKVQSLVQSGQAGLLQGQDPAFSSFPNAGLFPTELGPGILVMPPAGAFNAGGVPRIDGFTITAADSGGGILVNGYGNNLRITNNRIRSNHGTYSAGIRIGHPVTPFAFGNQQVDADNDNILIQYNDISQNGSTGGGFEGATGGAGGGISIYNGTDNYQIRDNYIVGNFTTMSGAGIGHFGLSDNGVSVIDGNTIAFNQSFHQTVNSASGGGISIEGIVPAGGGLSFGSGSVTISNNKIQGNYAGSGDGGGIRLLAVNGLDVAASPDNSANWDQIVIDNNFIVNNIAGLAGGGISLQGAARVSITNNTIAHNDSTATSGPAFTTATTGVSAQQPAGIVARAHDAALLAAIGTGVGPEFSAFPNPVLTQNIIWRNRSFYFDINQNFPFGALQPPPAAQGQEAAWPGYWDLGLLGSTGQLNPLQGILTSLTGPDGAVYDNVTNTTAAPAFNLSYFNGTAGVVVVEDRQTPIAAAAALDEGGNFIDLQFGPLSLAGDYSGPAGVGAQGGIGVLETSAGSGGGGGGWGCFISSASGAVSSGGGNPILPVILGLCLIWAVAGLSRKMKKLPLAGAKALLLVLLTAGLISGLAVSPAGAVVRIQCPGDINDDAVPDPFLADGVTPNPAFDPDVVCKHIAAGDGFINMADGRLQYMFGFGDVTGLASDMVMMEGMLAANFPAPTIKVKEGQKLYLTLTNVGMAHRPDLFDPHSVHYHGFPNAAAVFDGVPEASIVINMGSSLTYFYLNAEPGTFIYHCHVEATEHMQMGMLGQLYVTPRQDGTAFSDPDGSGRVYTKFAYNDGDGSTGYDVDYPIQIASFDPDFHDASFNVQPLPFALMKDRYPMLNGRGYPDTVNPLELTNTADTEGYPSLPSQKLNALITATKGQKILLRISSLSTTSFHTLSALGIPMKVVGRGARILRGPGGKNLYYNTNSVDLGGGEAVDVILDTRDVAPGTYFLYAKNLDHLTNDTEDFGGMMTEIIINP